ncbi:MAG: hypothetical protein ACHQK9_01080 [Reyranellales bacterium]
MSTERTPSLIVRARHLLADQRGTVFIEYSSLVLLIAIAAIAVLYDTHSAPS